jgi:hypothetical protein
MPKTAHSVGSTGHMRRFNRLHTVPASRWTFWQPPLACVIAPTLELMHRRFNQSWRLGSFTPRHALWTMPTHMHRRLFVGIVGLTGRIGFLHLITVPTHVGSTSATVVFHLASTLHRPVVFPWRRFNRSPDFCSVLSNSSRLSFEHLKNIP